MGQAEGAPDCGQSYQGGQQQLHGRHGIGESSREVVGHIGLDKIEAGKDGAFDSHAFAHYLHHKLFEVNYGDGLVPLDQWFGTWHDGSAEGEARMNARYQKKVERMKRKAAKTTPAE